MINIILMSFCELCGRQVVNERKAVLIEGAVFNVCLPCSKRGKPYTPAATHVSKKRRAPRISPQRIRMTDDTILSNDFPRLIREARTKKGLTHEQLGMQMGEKASLLRKFETGSLKPDEVMARKLERSLGIKLYVSVEEEQ